MTGFTLSSRGWHIWTQLIKSSLNLIKRNLSKSGFKCKKRWLSILSTLQFGCSVNSYKIKTKRTTRNEMFNFEIKHVLCPPVECPKQSISVHDKKITQAILQFLKKIIKQKCYFFDRCNIQNCRHFVTKCDRIGWNCDVCTWANVSLVFGVCAACDKRENRGIQNTIHSAC